MKLGEVTLDSHIEVAVVRNDTSVNLNTTVLAAEGDVLYVNPFMHNDSMITFKTAPGLKIELTAVQPGEVPNFWNSVTIEKGTYEGRYCHVITSGISGVRLNRRNSFRVFIGIDGTCVEQVGGRTYKATVKDISSNGIGLIMSGGFDPDFKPAAPVHITYHDDEQRFNLEVDARVVRKDVHDDGTVVYGCKFMRLYPQIDKYVTQKQLKNRNKKKELQK